LIQNFLKTPIFQNISWHFIYRIARLSLAFFVTAWMARYLGPENYGVYIYSIALAELVMLFWSQGLKEVVIQQIKEIGLEKPDVSVASFQLMIIGNTILYGVLALIVFTFNFDIAVKSIALICGIGIWFRCFESFELWFHSSLKIRVTVFVQFVAQLIYMISNILLILYSAELVWFAYAYAGQLIIAGIGFLLVFPIKNINLFKGYKKLQSDLLSIGVVMIIGKLTHTSSIIIDRILIESFLGNESVGIYVASMKLTITWIFISSAIAYSFIPVLTSSKSDLNFTSSTKKMFQSVAYISIVLAALIFFVSDELVHAVFGNEYINSSKILKVLIFSLPFLFLSEGIKSWLVVRKKTKYFMYSMIATTVLSIILNFFMIPYLGIQGAALSFILSWAFGGFLIFLVFKETRPLFIYIIKSIVSPIKILRKKTRD